MSTDLLFDANSLYARAWYATTQEAEPTAPLSAALNSVLSLLSNEQKLDGEHVDRMLFAWDGLQTRDKGRAAKPSAYYETRDVLIEYLTLLFRPAHAILPTYEADDLVATAAHSSTSDTVFVVSGDKDLQQLASHRVHYYSLNEKALLSLRQIRDKWYVKQPSQVAIALAIIGDRTDLVQGIKGWGPKRVKKLFEAVTEDMNFEQAFETVFAQIPEKLQENFLRDLDLTLLHFSVKGVPEPAPLILAPLEVVETLKLPELMNFYRPVFHKYAQRRTSLDDDGDTEEVP